MLGRAFWSFAAAACAWQAAAADLVIDADRMAVVDGKRTFILGLYENPEADAALKEAADSGFNLVYAAETAESLDRLHRHGLWAWLNTGYRIDFQEDAEGRAQQLRDMVEAFAEHPALLVWEVPDEALWNCWYGAMTWRRREEPAQLREKIDGLGDRALAGRLSNELDEARGLYEAGEYAASEAAADAIWKALGEEQPRPGLNVSNAAERAAAMGRGMVDGARILRALDPAHPIWMNHAPRNQREQLAAFNLAADIVGCDIYPVPRSAFQEHSDIALTTAAAVGEYTRLMQEAAPGKPVWMVLQGFGWPDLNPDYDPAKEPGLRRPNAAETRFMAFNSIVRGARGILYWGTFLIEKDSELWGDIMTLGNEIDALQPVLSAPDTQRNLTTTFEETWGSVDRKVEVLGKDVDGALWMIAVNEWLNPLRYTIQGLEGLDGRRYRVRGTDAEATVTKGTLTLTIPVHGVHVLEPVGK